MAATFASTEPKKKILVADKLAPEGLRVLEAHADIELRVSTGLKGDALLTAVRDVHAIIVRSATQITAEVLAAAGALEVVGRAGVGVDNVDVASATKRGVLVMNTPGGSAVTTGEHALSLLCSLARQIPQATASMKAGKWEKSRFMGREMSGKTLGIVGVGNIGRVVADRARGLKMKVVAYDPFLSPEAASPLGIEVVTFDELLARADFVSIHAPLTPETRNLFGATAFEKMKRTAILVNCARGGIVDEAALFDALKSGRIAAAGLDVFEKEPPGTSPLFELDNFICTPHLGASTDEAQVAVSVAIAEQIVDYLTQGALKNAVNFPAISREQLEVLGPYVLLCDRMGRLLAQLGPAPLAEVQVSYEGGIARYDVSALTSALLAGLLARSFSEEVVNQVNARGIAESRGISIAETRSERAKDYASLVTVRVAARTGEMTVAGTLFGATDARIVRVDQFRLEVLPEGHAIVVHNHDRPGVIGAIGTALGREGINVSRMQLGLDRDKGEALSVWNVDRAPSAALCDELVHLTNTVSVRAIDFGG
jgi:D-3-phosphoglycerate dehydrogenase